MNYELFAMIVGFTGLAFVMNRNTVTLMGQMEQVRRETTQRFDRIRTETGERIEGLRQEMNRFRTEMNRRFDESKTEMNRRFDTISRDIAALREGVTRVEESLKSRDARSRRAA